MPSDLPLGAPLPSQSSAAALVGGDITAAPTVVFHLLGRAAIIAAGMGIAGERDAKRLVVGSLAGSTAIELFVLIHELTNQARPQLAAGASNSPERYR
jgi:hypothetical protein